eukprot:TRINITY_DN41803_c0_g1_i1.p1 TRINITY_DN41803_c0_g1~~TRINITY_DN41803_c0_g1_i1.p1  ORF type:complete len:189 (-),score=13.63 TRINITY_DN41803_c0_g1_i1:441-1007(-)
MAGQDAGVSDDATDVVGEPTIVCGNVISAAQIGEVLDTAPLAGRLGEEVAALTRPVDQTSLENTTAIPSNKRASTPPPAAIPTHAADSGVCVKGRGDGLLVGNCQVLEAGYSGRSDDDRATKRGPDTRAPPEGTRVGPILAALMAVASQPPRDQRNRSEDFSEVFASFRNRQTIREHDGLRHSDFKVA